MSCEHCNTAQENGEVAYPFRVGGPVGDDDVPFASVLVFACPVHAAIVRADLLVAGRIRESTRVETLRRRAQGATS